MNEQLLRDRMRGATAGIHPASRLDEILAGHPQAIEPLPPVPRRPTRRGAVIALAAAVILLVALGAVLARRSDTGTTHLDSDPVTTTVAGEPPDGRIGQRISIEAATLPAGMQLIDESPRTDDPELRRFIRFARDEGTWEGPGPYLRINVDRGADYGTQWVASAEGDPMAQVGGHDVYRITDPVRTGGADWVIYGWATGTDEVVEVQVKGIDEATALAIANTVAVAP